MYGCSARPITSGCVRDCSSISSKLSITIVLKSFASIRRPTIIGMSLSSCGYGTDHSEPPPRVRMRSGWSSWHQLSV